ncbi:MAG: 1-acyl-sn-glycerol-3-phosphate acyltransferase [Chloroflexota bacterium]|nr:MAG: 1-acyl-sn-glycerol-3-phosphate acyltransferase [Chloroflexota bacterium]
MGSTHLTSYDTQRGHHKIAEPEASIADPRDAKRYALEETIFRRILTQMVRGAFSLFAIIDVKGRDHFPADGPVVLVANHLNHLDVFPMQLALPRPIFFMGKAELFQNPLVDLVFRNLGGFPVYRGSRDRWALEHARKILENGQVLGIFPEGKRSQGRGMRPGKSGAARLALETHSPIVPMAIDGTQHVFKHFPSRSRITLHIGLPIIPEPGQSPLALTDQVMFSLAALLPYSLRGVYAERPEGF